MALGNYARVRSTLFKLDISRVVNCRRTMALAVIKPGISTMQTHGWMMDRRYGVVGNKCENSHPKLSSKQAPGGSEGAVSVLYVLGYKLASLLLVASISLNVATSSVHTTTSN